jgi:hypothetical protein
MRFRISRRSLLSSAIIAAVTPAGWRGVAAAQSSLLSSWNDNPVKKSITDFVDRVTRAGGPDYVPIEERIATFDNDGTLWCEQPVYFQFAFGLDRVRAMVPEHPEWTLAALGEKGLLKLVATAHSGMTTDAFAKTVAGWLATARHPRFNRPYNELVYQPMLELLAYLRATTIIRRVLLRQIAITNYVNPL